MAYDPTTPHSLLSRGEAIAKHIGSVVVGLGHDLVLEVERLVGLAPKPEPVAAAPVSEAEATPQQQDPRIAAIIDLLNKAWPERIPSTDLVADTSDVILHLQEIAIDANGKLIDANDQKAQLAGELTEAQAAITERDVKLSDATEAQLSMGKTIHAQQQDIDGKAATIATLETSVADLKKGPFPPPAATVIDDAAPAAAPEGAAGEAAPGVVADVTETTMAVPTRETPVT